ncbi:MAG: flavin reductase family protein [Bryobacteraceae bacterium]|nr:flavin reductase family protein [Bryobacteraceae bacterium]
MPFDSALQRKIMGHFATGVTVVTTRVGDEMQGMTANAVASLSLNPAEVLVCIDQRAAMFEYVKSSRCYAMNFLAASQEDISRRFAAKGPKDFSDLDWFAGETGSPVFRQSLAYVDCRVVDIAKGGDHDIFIGEIIAGDILQADAPPLLYYAGHYRKLEEPNLLIEG